MVWLLLPLAARVLILPEYLHPAAAAAAAAGCDARVYLHAAVVLDAVLTAVQLHMLRAHQQLLCPLAAALVLVESHHPHLNAAQPAAAAAVVVSPDAAATPTAAAAAAVATDSAAAAAAVASCPLDSLLRNT
jgi:hypothetical protein